MREEVEVGWASADKIAARDVRLWQSVHTTTVHTTPTTTAPHLARLPPPRSCQTREEGRVAD